MVQTFPYRLRVAIQVHLFDLIDYAVSAEEFEHAMIGARVRVPFMRQLLIGIIVEKVDATIPFTAKFKLKSVDKIFHEPALLDPLSLQVLRWAADYYQTPVGEVVLSALPTFLKQGRPYQLMGYHWKSLEVKEETPLPKKTAQLYTAYQILQLHRQGTTESILNDSGVTTAQLKTLEKRGLAECFKVPLDVTPIQTTLAQMPLDANPEQIDAIHHIHAHLHHYQGFLLDGITGSGKTEVYLQAMQKVLDAGKQVLVLVPEIGLTPQTVARFKQRFHTHIELLHSGLNDTARFVAWQHAQTGKANIIIGTRLAIFCPLPRLGLIILDEEHDLSFKQQDMFRYHARDVALYRAFHQQCPIILGSATPSFESLALVQQGKLQHLLLRHRAGQAIPPKFQLIDAKAQKIADGLSPQLIHAIRTRLEKSQQILVFINRRGFAPVFMCTSCAWQADCPHCDAHLTVHYQPSMRLQCHHCNFTTAIPAHCPKCQSTELKPIGQGTARIEDALKSTFPDYPVIRVDRDTTTTIKHWEKIYARAHEQKPVIFLGTQMLAKGHHFPFVSLVTILNIDTGLWSADFRAPERTAQLIMQVAGRAGRGNIAGLVLLQSLRPEHPLLYNLVTQGYDAFAKTALTERQSALLPPFRYAVLLSAESTDENYTLDFLNFAVQHWSHFGTVKVDFWGPTPSPMQKRADFFRAQVLILCSQRQALQQQARDWWKWLFMHRRQYRLRLTLDVDPQELN